MPTPPPNKKLTCPPNKGTLSKEIFRGYVTFRRSNDYSENCSFIEAFGCWSKALKNSHPSKNPAHKGRIMGFTATLCVSLVWTNYITLILQQLSVWEMRAFSVEAFVIIRRPSDKTKATQSWDKVLMNEILHQLLCKYSITVTLFTCFCSIWTINSEYA